MLVQHLLESGAEAWPDRIALICGDRRVTYSELEAQANRLSHALITSGVQQGDRVAIILENSIEVAVALFAALKAGAIFMVLPPGIKHNRLSAILEDAEPTALVTDRMRMREHTDIVAEAPTLRCLVWSDSSALQINDRVRIVDWSTLPSYPDTTPHRMSVESDLATIIYTSGSTGQPKGVMCTHANMIAATTSVNGYLHNNEDDVILNGLPFSFGYGLYQIFLAFQVGARVVIEKNFAFPARVASLLEQEEVTALPGVPTFFALLLQYPDLLKSGFPKLRYITNAAAALPASHLQQIRATFPNARIFSMYGQTECKRVCYLPPEELDRRPSSVGIAIPNSQVYIVDEMGERVPPGQVGELVVEGPHVMSGYWRAPELTRLRFRPGTRPGERLLYTGDLFRMDDDGFLYFVARKDDIIKCRGEKVSPLEIENAVYEMEGVALAAVVGVPDPILGQAIRLIIVRREGSTLTEREVKAYCARHLDDYMMPKYIDFMLELPRTENGKINRKELIYAGT
jgi:amino acid adenylation domain-containing protein